MCTPPAKETENDDTGTDRPCHRASTPAALVQRPGLHSGAKSEAAERTARRSQGWWPRTTTSQLARCSCAQIAGSGARKADSDPRRAPTCIDGLAADLLLVLLLLLPARAGSRIACRTADSVPRACATRASSSAVATAPAQAQMRTTLSYVRTDIVIHRVASCTTADRWAWGRPGRASRDRACRGGRAAVQDKPARRPGSHHERWPAAPCGRCTYTCPQDKDMHVSSRLPYPCHRALYSLAAADLVRTLLLWVLPRSGATLACRDCKAAENDATTVCTVGSRARARQPSAAA
jgi:hypothetical protein